MEGGTTRPSSLVPMAIGGPSTARCISRTTPCTTSSITLRRGIWDTYRPIHRKPGLAPLICYDQWFPEAARANAIRGAEVLFYPTAIGWFGELRREEPFSARRWEDAMRAHASMNGVFAVAVNRVGKEDGLKFWGGSFVADPFGQVIARASSTREEVLVVEIDLGRVRESRDGWGFLENRRPDTYRDLARLSHGFSSRRVGDAVRARRAPGGHRRRT